MHPILFSCIVTCYNRETLIQRALLSILNQSYPNFEIIVVDDCSTDKSVEKILALEDPRIHLVQHTRNQGQNAAINSGIKAAKHDYLAFLDSDDEWLPSYLSEMHNAYLANPTISFAYSSFVNGPKLTLEGEQKYAETLNQGFLSSMITITAKKHAVNSVGNFDTRYTGCQDDDFCFRMAKNFSFKVITKELAIVHGSENSVSNNLVKVAEGWEFLFHNYKKDIIAFCGNKTLSKHYMNLSVQLFRCKEFKKGLHFYFASFYYLIKKNRNKRFKYSLLDFLKSTWNIIKLNLRHIKRLSLK